jgi:hypothetical protein
VCAVLAGGAYLAVRDPIADTNVHSGLTNVRLATALR